MGIAATFIAIGALSIGQMEPLPYLGSLTAQLRAPARLAVAPDGSVLVTDPLSRHIVRFDSWGNLVGTWPVPAGPVGIAAHPDGRVFVSISSEPKVAVYDDSFSFQEYLGENEPLVSLVGPTDIDVAVDTGRIYVVDAEGDRIYVFEDDGSLALIIGLRGKWPGQFIYPSAITVDEVRGRLIIADHDKWRLQTFTTSGVLLQQFGDRKKSTSSGMEGWMPRPQGLTVDAAGNIYVTDALMGTVRVFDPSGAELGRVVDYGYEAGGLRVPCDIAMSNDGLRLYVVSTNSSSVEVYDTSSGVCLETGAGDALASVQPMWLPDSYQEVLDTSKGVSETAWDGPHIVEDRPNICWPCHGITGQPGTHGGTVEGQGALCMSCHNAAGRALSMIIHEGDVADPFRTNPAAADGAGRSHAWGVPAVNAMADAVGPRPGSAMSLYLDDSGNIKCSTCHNQHNTYYGPYLRVDNTGDAMCKECHAPRDKGLGELGSHPVGFEYPEGENGFPPGAEIGPLILKDGMVECMTCHAPHGADSGGANDGAGDGMLLRETNDQALCQTCHVEHAVHFTESEWKPTCRECHDVHDTDNRNSALIAREINGTPVAFLQGDDACYDRGSSIHSVCDPPTYDGVCEVCHTATDYHLNSAGGDHAHYADMRCTDCHPHSDGFLASETYCTVCHGEPPDGAESPNQAGSHGVHLTGTNGPNIPDCYTCHASEDAETHDNGAVTFISGVDTNEDGNVDLAETDVCDICHSSGGPIDGVNDPLIGAKVNWMNGVYDGDTLKPDKLDWCAGCHDTDGSTVNNIQAPPVAGDNDTWGNAVVGHGFFGVACTECHNPTLPHTDGVSRTFGQRFPLRPGGMAKPPEERELDKKTYNDGYRLRRTNGERALEVPRDWGPYSADDFRMCFECHDEVTLMGVPSNYGAEPMPPPYLRLPEGVAQTNYRNEIEWGFNWAGKPVNAHWYHTGLGMIWDIDHDYNTTDSAVSCVTCHNPHGARNAGGRPTKAMTPGDLDISYGVYDDGEREWEYGFIGSGGFYEVGGDLHCLTCHPWFGEGNYPPTWPDTHTRYFRTWLDLQPEVRGGGGQ